MLSDEPGVGFRFTSDVTVPNNLPIPESWADVEFFDNVLPNVLIEDLESGFHFGLEEFQARFPDYDIEPVWNELNQDWKYLHDEAGFTI